MRKNRIKAALTGLMTAVMLGACAGDSGVSADSVKESVTPEAQEAEQKPEEGAESGEKGTEEPGAEGGVSAATGDMPERSSVTQAELEKMSSVELARFMGNGINLGNTMEATDNTNWSRRDVSFWETYWGQPVTTQEMIDDMKNAGLDTLRIPVAWTNGMDVLNKDYTIDPALLSRVKEIVDYAYADDMFVVLNDHWDRGWWGMFGSEDAAQRDEAWVLYESMWTQVAEYFKDYDHHLIFEGGNEEIGDRLNDINDQLNPRGAVLGKDECYQRANEINQRFVDLVRSTGGNNATRFLLIPGYGTDVTQTLDERWHMPTDSAEGKLFLSVHYYTPWNYCGGSGSSTWGTKKNYEEMDRLMGSLDKYGKDYGIIIGECGVLPASDGGLKPNTLLWMTHFFAYCDLKGYVPLLWNTGDILKKYTHQWIDPEYEQFLKDNSYESQRAAYGSYEAVAAAAEEKLKAGRDAAPETFQTDAILSGDGKALAWIMWNSAGWDMAYSVGDTYNPDDITAGLIPGVTEITGEGEYEVSLDFTGTDRGYSNSTAFSAIGISNGEELFPGYVITIKELLINDEPYELHGRNYTSSDDGLCTRTNLYNGWVASPPSDARTIGGGLTGASPQILDPADEALQEVRTIKIVFSYTPGAEGISPNDANSKN